MKNIFMKVFKSFITLDTRALVRAVSNEIGLKIELTQRLVTLLRVYRLRNLQKRMSCALIVGVVEGTEAIRIRCD